MGVSLRIVTAREADAALPRETMEMSSADA
jgi:hypothetical protein